MKTLIVGAGAVGQIYGASLAKGGQEVSVYVRPRWVPLALEGYPVRRHGAATGLWRPAGVLTRVEELAARRWDRVWICTASPALREPWLPELLAAVPGASIVLLTPGLHDRELLLEFVPAARLNLGMITLMGWSSPLPGEQGPKETLWWPPPLSPALFEGPEAEALAAELAAGGVPAKATADVAWTAGLGSAGLIPAIAALELAGWRFDTLRAEGLPRLCAAAVEAMNVVGAVRGKSPGLAPSLLRPWIVGLITRLAPLVAPVNMEVYLCAHFSKVRPQTLAGLSTWIEDGEARGLPTTALRELLRGLSAAS